MRRPDFFKEYLKLAPIQLSLWRTPEVAALSEIALESPILDLACGDGIFTTILLKGKNRKKIFGVDINKTEALLAEKTGTFNKVLIARAENLPFEQSSFQTIISNSSIEHFSNLNEALSEVKRVLKKGGRFIFIVPSVFLDEYWFTSFLTRRIPILGRVVHRIRSRLFGHKYIYHEDAWIGRLKSANFEVVNYTYINNKAASLISDFFWPFRLPHLLMKKWFKKSFLFSRGPLLALAPQVNRILKVDHVSTNSKKGSALLFVTIKK